MTPSGKPTPQKQPIFDPRPAIPVLTNPPKYPMVARNSTATPPPSEFQLFFESSTPRDLLPIKTAAEAANLSIRQILYAACRKEITLYGKWVRGKPLSKVMVSWSDLMRPIPPDAIPAKWHQDLGHNRGSLADQGTRLDRINRYRAAKGQPPIEGRKQGNDGNPTAQQETPPALTGSPQSDERPIGQAIEPPGSTSE